MIQLFKYQKSPDEGLGTLNLVFIDNLYFGTCDLVYKINPQYNDFMKNYSSLNKEERLKIETPEKWLFDYYYPFDNVFYFIPPIKDVANSKQCKSLEELEAYFRFSNSQYRICTQLKNSYGDNKIVPI